MASSLSNLVNYFLRGIHKTKCQYRHNEKNNVNLAESNISIATVFLNTEILKMI